MRSLGFAILCSVLSTTTSYAQLVVSKVSANPVKVGLTSSSVVTVKVGDIVDAKTKKGSLCAITISKITPTIVFGDTLCAEVSDLIIGEAATAHAVTADDEWNKELASKASPNPNPMVAPPAAPAGPIITPAENVSQPAQPLQPEAYPIAPPKRKHSFGIGLYYSFANRMSDDGQISGVEFDGETNIETGPGISLYYNSIVPGSIGSFVTIDHEFKRKAEDYQLNLGGTMYAGEDGSDYSMTLITTNIGFGISDAIGLYGGINLPLSVTVSDSSNVKYYGNIGYQVGINVQTASVVTFGMEYRAVRWESRYNDGIDSGDSKTKFDGALVRLGLSF